MKNFGYIEANTDLLDENNKCREEISKLKQDNNELRLLIENMVNNKSKKRGLDQKELDRLIDKTVDDFVDTMLEDKKINCDYKRAKYIK